jgi:hypothetical protein
MAKRIIIAAVAAVVVAAAWFGSSGLSGRGFGFGDGDCRLTGGRSPDGVLEGQARCKWPIPAERVEALLAAWGDQARYFSNLAESTVLERSDGRMLVRQIQRASGISDREVIIECTTEAIPGGTRYRWRKAPDQSKSSGRNVEVAVHEGFWEVTSSGEHETRVEYHMRYLPGGSVPSFIVSMFLSSGMEGVLSDLRRAAETRHVAANSAGA